MPVFAEIKENKVVNVIVANSIEEAELVTGSSCLDITDNYVVIEDTITPEQIKKMATDKAKRAKELAAAEAEAEAKRVKALELELERARQAEAERLAAEEAAKPKPVTGIFVKVEKN